jgi:Na+/melibiose symporter-like transporter
VFVGEVLIVAVILVMARRMRDAAPEAQVRFDFVGAVLTALGLGLAVVGILQSSEWGWVRTKPDGPSILGLSPTIWLVLAGLIVVWIFLERASRLEARGGEPLVRPSLLANRQVSGGLLMFLLLYLVQAGLFFTIPLFLSVALGLSALETGIRILPLSITLLAAAVGVPRLYPQASPRRVVRLGLLALLLGVLFLMVALEPTADAQIVTLPLLLAGLGIGALASQLGAVTVSAVPDEVSPEVGGLQNTATNLGAAIGTALAGSILISSLTGAFLQGVEDNNAVPPQVSDQAQVQLANGVPFLSDADLRAALEQAAVPPDVSAAVLEVNATARVEGLRDALAVLLLIAAGALVAARRIPDEPVGGAPPSVAAGAPPERTP